MIVHAECGERVELSGGVVLDLDGGEHLCRDYVAWHLPADRRHPDDLPWPAHVDRVVPILGN